MPTKDELAIELNRTRERLSLKVSDVVSLQRKVKELESQAVNNEEHAAYHINKMNEIRQSLETVAAVKFPNMMLGFDVAYSGTPRDEIEDELLCLLRHLYRLTN